MSDATRSRLEDRKRDLYDAIRTLDGDRRDGTMDAEAYAVARRRYELEAAGILEQLDLFDQTDRLAPQTARAGSRRRLVIVGSGGVVVLAIALFLGGALRARTGSAAITGDVGQATPAPASGQPSQVLAARGRVSANPLDPTAELALATAYVNAKNPRAANAAYLRAIQLAPHRPEARTMYAVFKGSRGDAGTALTQLALVERESPAYAKAWLIDGLLSSRIPAGLPRAIRAWHRFLVLSPHAPIAPQVRALLTSAERAQKQPR